MNHKQQHCEKVRILGIMEKIVQMEERSDQTRFNLPPVSCIIFKSQLNHVIAVVLLRDN